MFLMFACFQIKGAMFTRIVRIVSLLLIAAGTTYADISDRPITIRLPPQNLKPNFMKEMVPPRTIQSSLAPTPSANRSQRPHLGNRPSLTPAAQLPVIPPASSCSVYKIL